MAYRFLTLLLFGVLALAAFDGFEERRERRDAADRSATTVTMDDAQAQAAYSISTNPPPPTTSK